ncbi:MAG: radical SAM family heme chaperone HemW [Planctomycetota bacterium]
MAPSLWKTPFRGLYIHVPFCVHKCHYCDFYSLVDRHDRMGAFLGRLLEELEASRPFLREPLETVFVGGGTPTLLGEDRWARLLGALGPDLSAGCEVTVEANPETVTADLAEPLVRGGVNRLSIGAQSFDARHLRTLERHHDPANVERSVRSARAAGIRNLNLDLIFGIPGQTLDQWRADLERALRLEPDHLSCYGLVYEPNTPLTARMKAGLIERADETLEARMYELAMDTLADAGFEHYEISNWARPGRRCRHNLLYWRNESWWPLGPSAAGHAAGVRWKNVARLEGYLGSRGLPEITDVECLDADGRVGETLMLGLRLIEGLEVATLDARRAAAIERHLAAGLLERRETNLRLTRHGLLLADTVLSDLL